MKRHFRPMFMPHPTIPPRPKNEVKQESPQVEADTLSQEFSERPNVEQYMPGPGWGDGMMPMHPLAEARVRWQRYGQVYNPVEALQIGTIFPELYRPYPG